MTVKNDLNPKSMKTVCHCSVHKVSERLCPAFTVGVKFDLKCPDILTVSAVNHAEIGTAIVWLRIGV